MSGLFLQGLGSLLFRLMPALDASAPYLVGGLFGIDRWHAGIDIIWGAVGMGVLAVGQAQRPILWLALSFGVFYTTLAVAGVLIHHPFGLKLDSFENGFHLTAGPLTLVLAAGMLILCGLFTHMLADKNRMD